MCINGKFLSVCSRDMIQGNILMYNVWASNSEVDKDIFFCQQHVISDLQGIIVRYF